MAVRAAICSDAYLGPVYASWSGSDWTPTRHTRAGRTILASDRASDGLHVGGIRERLASMSVPSAPSFPGAARMCPSAARLPDDASS